MSVSKRWGCKECPRMYWWKLKSMRKILKLYGPETVTTFKIVLRINNVSFDNFYSSLFFFFLLKTQWTRPNSRTNWPGPHPVSICSNIFGSISGRHQGRVCSRHVVSVERLFKKPRTVTGSRRHVGSISSRFITGSWIQDQHLYVRCLSGYLFYGFYLQNPHGPDLGSVSNLYLVWICTTCVWG